MLEAEKTHYTKSPAPSGGSTSLFDRALVAEGLWRHHADTVWSQLPCGSPAYERANVESDILSNAYEALFCEFCDFAIAHPSLETLGQVVVLWRLRCWDENSEIIGLMEDDFEARAIVKLSEILTGIKL